MSGLFFLALGVVGQWLLGVGVVSAMLYLVDGLLLRRTSVQVRDGSDRPATEPESTGSTSSVREMTFCELAGVGLVVGIGLNAWLLFVWSLAGGRLGFSISLALTMLGMLSGMPFVWTTFRSTLKNRRLSKRDPRRQTAIVEKRAVESSGVSRELVRACRWMITLLTLSAFVQVLLTPQHFWDERAIFAIKGLVLDIDQSIHSSDLKNPDFVQYHPRYPLILPLAEQHLYALLGYIDDRWSKLVFPLMYLGVILAFVGVLTRNCGENEAWLFGVLLATIPVLMPYELGFLSGQADAPMACYHGVAVLYVWDALRRRRDSFSESPLQSSGPENEFPNRDSSRIDQPVLGTCDFMGLRNSWLSSAVLAGVCGALAAFVKDEGTAFLMVDEIALALVALVLGIRSLYTRTGSPKTVAMDRSNDFRMEDDAIGTHSMQVVAMMLVMIVLAITILGPWSIHKKSLPTTTEMSYFDRASIRLVLERLPVLGWQVEHLIRRTFFEWHLWGLHWWMMLFAFFVVPKRLVRPEQMFLVLDVLGGVSALILAGMLAPAQLDEHIGGSSYRFLMQIAPVAVLFAAGQLCRDRRLK